MVKIQLRWGERREQVAQPALGFVGLLLMEGESPEKKAGTYRCPDPSQVALQCRWQSGFARRDDLDHQ